MPVTSDPVLALVDEIAWTDYSEGIRPAVITYGFIVPGAGEADITPLNEKARAAVRAAFAAWDAVTGMAFVEVTDPYPNGLAMINLGFADLGGEALGVAGSPGVGTPILFDVTTAGASWTPGNLMFLVALHEIGHALGLKHPFEGSYTLTPSLDNHANTVMSYTSAGLFYPDRPAPLDVSAIQWLYGTQASEATDGIAWSFDATAQSFTFTGDNAANGLVGTGNADKISGLGGNDTIYGGLGHDAVQGGDGDDRIIGEGGRDTLLGGAGNDILYGDDPNISGFDYGLLGDADILRGGDGADSLYGLEGDDILEGGPGKDYLDGGDGFDIAIVAATKATLNVTPLPGGGHSVMDPSGPFTETYISIEAIQASDGVVLLGSDDSFLFKRFDSALGESVYEVGDLYVGPVTYLRKTLFGTGASEIFGGTAQADQINAFGGDDAVDGGLGDDVIDGGTGSNFLTGGGGWDTFFLDGRGGTVTWGTITDWQAGEHLSVWGYKPGISKVAWKENDGADGYRGITMHADLDGNGVTDTSATWSGLTFANLPKPIALDGLLWFN